MHELIKEQLKDFQSGFNDFTKRKTTSNKKMSFRLATTKNKTTSPITPAKKVNVTSKKLPSRTTTNTKESSSKNKKDSVMSPLNETTISSLDLTVITPQTPRREKNKGISSNKNNNNYKNESRHCRLRGRQCCGGGGGGDGVGDCVNVGGEVDGSSKEVDVDYLQKFKCDNSKMTKKSTVSTATSPFKFDCGCSPFDDYKLEPPSDRLVTSARKLHEHGRFKKKDKISDFIDFIELLSEYSL